MNINVVIYFILSLLIPLALLSQGSYKKQRGRRIGYNWSSMLLLSFILTVIIRSIPYDTETDWIYYYEYAKAALEGNYYSWGEHAEIGYQTLVKTIGFFGLPPISFFFIFAIIWNYSILKLASKFIYAAPYIVWEAFLYLFNDSLNIYRQYLGMAFVLMAVAAYLQKRKTKAMILFGLGFSMHVSTIITIPAFLFYFLCNKYNVGDKMIMCMILLTTIMGSTFLYPLVNYANNAANLFTSINSNEYALDSLLDDEWEQNYVWVRCILSLIVVFFANKIKNQYQDFSLLYYVSAFFYILSPFFQQGILARMAMVWRMFIPYMIGVMIYHYLKREKNKVPFFLLSVVIIFDFLVCFKGIVTSSELHPYVIKDI